jgi:hypothetical protein
LKTLYEDLQRSFNARPSDLKKCGALLTQLKVKSPLLIWCAWLTSSDIF